VVDGYVGWDENYRVSVRLICARAYHALFMRNMIIPLNPKDKSEFKPEWVIYNAGQFPATTMVEGVTCETSVTLNFKKREFVILGSQYAGEIKKGIFTILNYIYPKQGVLSMHCSCNEGKDGDSALFFGLSGTGKTTLSADPDRSLIGDDEHGWTKEGIFNFEGGCYAKTVDLSREKEPEIWDAIRFGSVLENVVFDAETGEVDYSRIDYTENTRTSYPIEFIRNAKIPCVTTHPDNIIFLACDAYGVLPPVSRLSHEQAMFYFINGYTSKVAGTEVGIKEPKPEFSACFGAAFLVWHPMRYAELLRDKLQEHNTAVWLVNTGWGGGSYGVGKRYDLRYTRTIVNAILSGELSKMSFTTESFFGLEIPESCPNLPVGLTDPANSWQDKKAYACTAEKVAEMFVKNFDKYADHPLAQEIKNSLHITNK
jgi:phosphoenolpyruvate carboxykinase (ATP)